MRLIGNVEKDAQVRAVASGALSTGDTVVVNSDGTVSVVDGSRTTQTEIAAYNSPLSGVNEKVDICYDSGEDRIVAVYRYPSDTYSGYAIVGEVSGSSITWGTPVKYNNSYTREGDICYDSTNDKVVVVYKDDGDGDGDGRGRVGTVSGSGNSISFGTEFEWLNADVYHTQIEFNANSGKLGLLYSLGGSSGDEIQVMAGEVSGTSASFGSGVSITTSPWGRNHYIQPIGSNAFIIAYNDANNSNYLMAVVATVSGTTVSLGTATVVASALYRVCGLAVDENNNILITTNDGKYFYGELSSGNYSSIASGTINSAYRNYDSVYDPQTGLFLAMYQHSGDSDKTYAQNISVSGSTLTFSSSTLINGNSSTYPADGFGYAMALDTSQHTAVSAWHVSSGSALGIGLYRPNYTETITNLTAENFLGYAAAPYANAKNAVINSTCTVDRNQTGLTAGQKYYVQIDGSLGTTADDPSVVAGTAISSTEIIVKG